ncbi:peptidase associated/transthyretin-like domain-containing protein [Tautonia sociabilis]|uniref:Carboxypeptidase regulatory-like domain-containing protein n=1 Tax=Tautonia sociabilis TaxID=2080755 RepID=A0A432MHB7_9BACT|nr:hypothetical protein [Tautonia sociabilis]RUL86183.1 hypothetical protein TsocGM_16600 [Tautonia sociabilis]
MSLRIVTFVSVGLLTLAAGCGDAGPELVPVSGTVVVNGEPLARATVIFEPTDTEDPNLNSGGQTDEQGHFELQTIDGRKGAVVGNHRVTITPPMTVTPDPVLDPLLDPDDENDLEYFVAQGNQPKQLTPQTVEYAVPPGGTDAADIKIQVR